MNYTPEFPDERKRPGYSPPLVRGLKRTADSTVVLPLAAVFKLRKGSRPHVSHVQGQRVTQGVL